MAELLKTKSLNWQDVNLIAQPGEVKSRKEVPIEGKRLVVSAMTSIIGPSFIKAVASLPKEKRPTLHIPRDIYKWENLNLCFDLKLENVFVGVGLQEDLKYETHAALNLGYTTAFIDIANGYLPQIAERVKNLRLLGFKKIICGSVHTSLGFNMLDGSGVDIIRTGIAPGSVCITSDSTGFTRGTFTEIFELNKVKVLSKKCLLADGGIKSPSCYIKAFLAGADYVMAGRPFVNAKECRMNNYEELFIPSQGNDNSQFFFPKNTYFGMASYWGKVAMNPNVLNDGNLNHIEGKQDEIKGEKIPLSEIIGQIWDGIRSGVSYSGYKTLSEAIGNGVFEEKV